MSTCATIQSIQNKFYEPKIAPKCPSFSLTIETNSERQKAQSLTEKKVEPLNLESIDAPNPTASTMLGQTVSHRDIFLLFIALLKLFVEQHHFEVQTRQLELIEQLNNMEKMVKELRSQGQWLLFTGIGAGIIGIVGAVSIPVCHAYGPQIMSKISIITSKFDGMKPSQFGKTINELGRVLGPMYENVGRVQNAYSKGDETRCQSLSDLHRTKGEDSRRRQDEHLQNWRQLLSEIERIAEQELRTSEKIFASTGG